jgi:hypothetical protein
VNAATHCWEQLQGKFASTTPTRDHLPINCGAACPIGSTATAHVATRVVPQRSRVCWMLGARPCVATYRVYASLQLTGRRSAATRSRPARATSQLQGSRLPNAARQVSRCAQRILSSPYVVALGSARRPAQQRPACNDLLLATVGTPGVCVVCLRSRLAARGWWCDRTPSLGPCTVCIYMHIVWVWSLHRVSHGQLLKKAVAVRSQV